MMQRFLFRCKGRTFSANNKEKTHFSSLFVIFLDERDAKRFKYRSEKGINVSSFLTYIKKEVTTQHPYGHE